MLAVLLLERGHSECNSAPPPLERLWANLKGIELASLTSEHFGEITSAAHAGINRSRRIPRLLSSFLTPPDSERATRPHL
jgi:hypothetical protein